MNTKILQKILEELKKDVPSIDYMKGMVETLMEMSGSIPTISGTTYVKRNNKTDGDSVGQVRAMEEVPAHLRAGPIGDLR